ncbi:ROK family protein [Halarchaeum nitratireducens]|uniref:Glucokinase n=1 Tax=Halarchaeum nitratireducens TaxID=489913 RepID=A0A830G8J2_9EURY|nr:MULTISPECIES: ROK family protein [Halarchaeum]MBP2251195.1 glucokinase [Halarchaeum solikamskense]GGN06612.1 glucokinase [Halarchaeum nitratireducens]
MAYYVGVDLGATNLRAAVADEEAVVLGTDRRGTPRGPSGIAVTEAVLAAIRTACANAGVDPTQVAAAGIGSIGPLDLADGAIDNPANLPEGIGRIPLVGPVRELVDSERVYLHNDTIAGVIGERFHSDRNPDDMVYLTISSGIGAGVAVDGNVLTGWDGNAGEVGHMAVDPDGRRTCGCGRDGHWEAYCSGNNIPRYAKQLAEERDADTALPVESDSFSAKDVFEHAESDDFANDVVGRIADWNTLGITNLAQAYAPLVVYVGGAVALNNPGLVLEPVRERLDETVFNNVPDLRLTNLGDDVVLDGAIASAITGGTGDRSQIH